MTRNPRQGRLTEVRRLEQKRQRELAAKRRIAEILRPLSLEQRYHVLQMLKKRLREEGMGG